MSDLSLLQLLADHGGAVPWSDLLNASDDPSTAHGFLLSLKARGYISGELRAHTTVRITPSGRKQLNELVNVKEEKEKREDQIRKDDVKSHTANVIMIVIAVLTLAATIIGLVLR